MHGKRVPRGFPPLLASLGCPPSPQTVWEWARGNKTQPAPSPLGCHSSWMGRLGMCKVRVHLRSSISISSTVRSSLPWPARCSVLAGSESQGLRGLAGKCHSDAGMTYSVYSYDLSPSSGILQGWGAFLQGEAPLQGPSSVYFAAELKERL